MEELFLSGSLSFQSSIVSFSRATFTSARGIGVVPTVGFEDDGDVVLHKGADVEQHGGGVQGAEAELHVVRRVVVAQAEVVEVGVDPVGPRRLVRDWLLPYVVTHPRADLEVGADV